MNQIELLTASIVIIPALQFAFFIFLVVLMVVIRKFSNLLKNI